jgi:DNA-binding CsgD family transcriptional regulator
VSSRKKARQWARLRMLCCSGQELITLGPDLDRLTRELVPSGASGLFLTNHDGEQYARHHEGCPESVERICVEGGALFDSPGEPNYRYLYRPGAPKVGQWRVPPRHFLASHTFQMLIRGCGYRHSLDTRLEVDGQRMGMFYLFRELGRSYTEEDAADMGRIALYLEHALRTRRPPSDTADRMVEAEALVVARTDGRMLFASAEAQDILRMIPLVRGSWPDRRRLPPLCLQLIDILRDDARHSLQMPTTAIALPGGRLEISAHWLGSAGSDDQPVEAMLAEGLVGLTLTRTTPVSLRIWRNLSALSLSPTQMEVAYWMAVGGGREAARARMPISESVLRDCVKAIYEKLGCSSQEQLRIVLQDAAMPSHRSG